LKLHQFIKHLYLLTRYC